MRTGRYIRRLLRIVVGAIVFTLIAAACSGDDLSSFDGADRNAGDSTATSGAGVDDEPQPAAEGSDRAAELIGRWEIFHYALPDGGGLTNVVGGEPVFMEFGVDGTLSYGTGCNQGTADYATSGVYLVPESPLDDTPEGQPIAIGPGFVQTEIGCEGFLGDQDRDLPANMIVAGRFRLDGDSLRLLDEFLLIEATKAG